MASISYFYIESQLKCDKKNLNKKIEELKKSNKELTTSLNNQNAISDLYLEDCKRLQQEIQQHTDEIKRLKNLQNNDQIDVNKVNEREIIFVRQNDEMNLNTYYHDLISQLKILYECPLSLDRLKNPIILPSGFTINEDYFDKLIDSKDPYNKEFIVKHKVHNRFANEVKEIVEASEKQMLEKKQNYEDFKHQLDTDRQERSKDTQTDFVVRADDDVAAIERFSSLVEEYKADGHRNQQIIEKLEEELECAKQENAKALEMLEEEQRKNEAKEISDNLIIKENKSLMCDLSYDLDEERNISFIDKDKTEY